METKYLNESTALSGFLLFYDKDFFEVKKVQIENLSTSEIKERYKRLILSYSMILKSENKFFTYDKKEERFFEEKINI